MKHVSILALHDATLASVDSSHQLFCRVNDFLRYQQRPPFYAVEVVGVERHISFQHGLYDVRVDKTLEETARTDVIVIPLLCGDFPKTIRANEPYRDWVTRQHREGAEIVCLCVGSFFLASTGLLRARKCAIHWAARQEFAALYPDVELVDDRIITDEAGIYTSAGGFSYLNLLLYIIEKHLGRDLSLLASKMFEIDIARMSQQPFAIFIGQRQHGDKEVLAAQVHIEEHPADVHSIDGLCARVGVGRRTFERRFRKCTGNSIAEYVQRVKVEFAKKQLERPLKTVNEIIYTVGYNDVDAFRKVFKRYTDLSPTEYRKRFVSFAQA